MAYLSHHSRTLLWEYAAPGVMAILLVVGLPLLGILALVMRGAVLLMVAAAVVIGVGVALWRVSVPSVHAWRLRHRPVSK